MLLFAMPPVCFAQSADKIIKASVRAMGGAKAMKKIRSSEWEGDMRGTDGGNAGKFTLITAAPGEFYREFVFGQKQMVEACNTSSCWGEGDTGNLYTLFGADEKHAEATGRYLNFALANYKKLKIQASYAGAENVDGKAADIVELSIPPGEKRRVYFDRESHFIVKEMTDAAEALASEARAADQPSKIANGAFLGGAEEIEYADYRRVQGVMEPFQLTILQNGRTFQVTINRISINSTVMLLLLSFPISRKSRCPTLRRF